MKTQKTVDPAIRRMAIAAAALARSFPNGFTEEDGKDVREIVRRADKLYDRKTNDQGFVECYAQAFAEFFEKVLAKRAAK